MNRLQNRCFMLFSKHGTKRLLFVTVCLSAPPDNEFSFWNETKADPTANTGCLTLAEDCPRNLVIVPGSKEIPFLYFYDHSKRYGNDFKPHRTIFFIGKNRFT